MSSSINTATPPKKASSIVSNPSPRQNRITNKSNRTTISVLKKQERTKINAHLDKINDVSGNPGTKFSFLEFGTDTQAVKGLAHLLGIDDTYSEGIFQRGEETMRSEVEALKKTKGDPSNWFSSPHKEEDGSYNWNERVPNLNEVVEHYNYVVDGVSSEKTYPNGIRDQGRVGVTLDYFMNQKECKQAGLAREHVIALRLYTTVVYKYINDPLRNPELYRNKRHPLAAVVYYIFQGIKMLRNCVDDIKGELILWRGAKNIQARNDFLENGGTELAPMSTSRTLAVALRYLSGMSLDQGAVLFRVVVTNKLSMGADLSWLSAFPDEGEVLYPPMTFLEPEKQHQQNANGEGVKVTRQETIVRQNMSQGLQIIEMKPNLSASDGINIKSSVTSSGKKKANTGDPLSDELVSFLTAAKVKVSDQLTIAFNELGFASIDDFDDLDEEMTASLEVAMKPLEVKRFRKSISQRTLEQEAERESEIAEAEDRMRREAVERSKKEAAAAREKAAALEQAAKKVRSKFKIGQAVTWTSSDNNVPEGTVGVVTSQCDDGVSANVKFRDGAWKFKYTQLRISSKKPTVSFFCSFFFD